MRKCAVDGCEEDMSLPFKCKLCGQYYCAHHRLPEQHNCLGLHVYQTEEYKHAKVSILPPKQEKIEKKAKIKKKEVKKERKKSKNKRTYSDNELFYDQSNRFLMYSSFFSIFSLKHHWQNILLSTSYLTAILILHLVVRLLMEQRPINLDILWALTSTVVATCIIYGGHWLVQYYVARTKQTVVYIVHWLQGLLFGLIGIILPFIIIPSYLTFPSVFNSNKEDRGKIALSGMIWMLVTSFAASIIANIQKVPDPIALGVSFVPFMFFIYMFFDLFPFGLSKGTHIMAWNRKAYWIVFSAVFVLFLINLILPYLG